MKLEKKMRKGKIRQNNFRMKHLFLQYFTNVQQY